MTEKETSVHLYEEKVKILNATRIRAKALVQKYCNGCASSTGDPCLANTVFEVVSILGTDSRSSCNEAGMISKDNKDMVIPGSLTINPEGFIPTGIPIKKSTYLENLLRRK